MFKRVNKSLVHFYQRWTGLACSSVSFQPCPVLRSAFDVKGRGSTATFSNALQAHSLKPSVLQALAKAQHTVVGLKKRRHSNCIFLLFRGVLSCCVKCSSFLSRLPSHQNLLFQHFAVGSGALEYSSVELFSRSGLSS
jgi:hypothetical protein